MRLNRDNARSTKSISITVNQTPLPAALPLFATGLGALGLLGWRRKRKQAGGPDLSPKVTSACGLRRPLVILPRRGNASGFLLASVRMRTMTTRNDHLNSGQLLLFGAAVIVGLVIALTFTVAS